LLPVASNGEAFHETVATKSIRLMAPRSEVRRAPMSATARMITGSIFER
jgi:hypothetical protein